MSAYFTGGSACNQRAESIIQPLIIAILLFLLIRPAAQWIEDRPIMQKYAHPLMPYGVLVVIFLLCYGLLRSCFTLTLQHSQKKSSLTNQLNDKLAWIEEFEIRGYSFDVSGVTALIGLDTINNYLTGFVGSLASFTASAVTVLIFLLFIV